MEYIEAKHIVSRSKNGSWFAGDYNMNIYRGCCHGCIYCDSRSACYGIADFDRVKPKRDALEIIRDDLRRRLKKGVVMTGSMSDPYNPHEKQLRLTRNALELINSFEFGVGIATKGSLITRDIDILQDIEAHSPVIVKLTVTAADDRLAKIIEPNAPPSSARLEALARLSEEGLFAGLLLMPVLPFITDNDDNIRALVRLAHEAGARFIYPAFGMTLRDSQRAYYYDRLDERFPGVKERYIKVYGNAYSCSVPDAKRLWSLFAGECEKYGIIYRMKTIIQIYKYAHKGRQLTLFD